MRKVYVYPYSYGLFEMLEKNRNLEKFEIIGIINDNKAIENVLSSKFNSKSISSTKLNERTTMDEVDGLLIYNPSLNEIDAHSKDIIDKFILSEKYIFYTCDLDHYISSLNYNKTEKLSNFEILNDEEFYKQYKLREVKKPVILVLGLGQNCDKNNVGLNLNSFFKEKGYNPALISGNTLGALFNFFTFPVLESKFEESVKKFNFMLNEIDRVTNPDLFIVTAPSGIVKHDISHHNLFGYPAFVITSAVVPDISILSVYAGKYEVEDISFLQNICYFKLNTKFNYLHIAAVICDLNLETDQLDFFPIEDSSLMKNLIYKHFPMYSVIDTDSKRVIHEKILEELRGNVKRI